MSQGRLTAIRGWPHALISVIKDIPNIVSSNKILLSVISFFYLFPLVTHAMLSPTRDLLSLLTLMMIFGLLAMSFDLQLGRAGLLDAQGILFHF